ncbi:MAG: molybdopterin-binding protein [Deltaproteobacteria bacterium]|nr:molybdopterin-binding protein [Deltaproteobacteria bacterium]
MSNLTRRQLLLNAASGAGFLLLSGCEKVFNALSENDTFRTMLSSAEQGNRRIQRLLAGRHKLAQEFSDKDISPYFRPNGLPAPKTDDYRANTAKNWTGWHLEVAGLVQKPGSFTINELRAMKSRTQITRHDCVEGWSAIAKWKGVPLAELLARVQPSTKAKYIVFYCMDTDNRGNAYYESIDMTDARHAQTILAYEMNDRALPIDHGAPLRLRVETQLGYKHAKYIYKLEFVESFEKIVQGKGGYWEDRGYEWYAGI